MKTVTFIALLLFGNVVFAQSSKILVASTNQFLNTLNQEELKKTVYAFDDSLRFKWTKYHYVALFYWNRPFGG